MARKKNGNGEVLPAVIDAEVTEDVDREAPTDLAIVRFEDIVQNVVNAVQFQVLRGKTPPHAVNLREGPGGRKLKYIKHGYVRDVLNKAFGFDWDFEILATFGGQPYSLNIRIVVDGKGNKIEENHLTVHGQLTVRIRNPECVTQVLAIITKSDFGSQVWRAGMEFGDALKAASSDALKRCALGLGVGADLYYDDDAALAQWATTQKKAMEVAEAIANPSVPTSLAMFIARAMQDYKLDAAGLTTLLGVSIGDLAKQFPDHAEEAWRTLSEKMTEVQSK